MNRKTTHSLENISVKNNSTLEIAYDDGTLDTLDIEPSLQSNEERIVKYTDYNGNNLIFNIVGENSEVPQILINEFITKGKKDKIELYVLEDGNLDGCTIMYGRGDNATSYTFSNRPVKKGEFVVLELEDGLSANNGFIEIYSTFSKFSPLLDKVVYSNKDVDATTEGWIGNGIDSTFSTATRSINRKMDNGIPLDTDTSDDWYITKTKGASWGEINNKEVYVKI